MLIVFQVLQVVGYYGFTSWVPTLLLAQGITVTRSLAYTVIIAAANPLGALAATQFADRCERKWQLALSLRWRLRSSGWPFRSRSTAIGIMVTGAMIAFSNTVLAYSLHAYQSELYPTRIRARAVGFTYSWSRISTVFVGFDHRLVPQELWHRWGFHVCRGSDDYRVFGHRVAGAAHNRPAA